MPTYQYLCDPDDGGCNNVIEVKCSMDDRAKKRPKSCPKCRKRKPLIQLYGVGSMHIPTTVGSLVDKQSSSMSEDEKHHLHTQHNKYRRSNGSDWVEVGGNVVHRSQLGD